MSDIGRNQLPAEAAEFISFWDDRAATAAIGVEFKLPGLGYGQARTLIPPVIPQAPEDFEARVVLCWKLHRRWCFWRFHHPKAEGQLIPHPHEPEFLLGPSAGIPFEHLRDIFENSFPGVRLITSERR